jgi:menaquinone-dependent protoporphyrinogen oxidase
MGLTEEVAIMTRVLVVHGSKHGATAEIAEWIGGALRDLGLEADVHPARSAPAVTSYDAVIVGGALYASRWHRDARRFVRRQARTLRRLPVWLFSSGPLDRTANGGEIPPVRGVTKAAQRIGARGQVTFGGRLETGTGGIIASRLARERGGDFRDRDAVGAWSAGVAADLASITEPRS